MKAHRILYTLLLSFSAIALQAQPIETGQQYPDPLLNNVIGYPASSLKLSGLKAKLVILDFWATSCKGCIESFPKIEALQKQFNGQVQFILVNSQSKDSTERFFAKRKKIKRPSVPLVTADTLLSQMFPHNSVPTHVWIDGQMNVRYITEGYNATAEHLVAFLDGEKLSLARKEYRTGYNDSRPQFAQENQDYAGKVLQYSFIAKCIKGKSIGNANAVLSGDRITLSRNCSSILDLFKTAFSEGQKYDFRAANTCLLLVEDSNRFVLPADSNKKDEWYRNHSYNYQLVTERSNAGKVYATMQNDLQSFFGLSARIEKRMLKALVLVRTSAKDKLAGRAATSAGKHRGLPPQSFWYFRNTPFQDFLWNLKSFLYSKNVPLPVVDSTGYAGLINLAINTGAIDKFSMEAIKKELAYYDLDLVEKECLVDVLVIEQNER
jgi:thiol-disulfide isomerase/thioredoxin